MHRETTTRIVDKTFIFETLELNSGGFACSPYHTTDILVRQLQTKILEVYDGITTETVCDIVQGIDEFIAYARLLDRP